MTEDEFEDWHEEPEIDEEEAALRFQIEQAGAWWENREPVNIEEVRRIDRFCKATRN